LLQKVCPPVTPKGVRASTCSYFFVSARTNKRHHHHLKDVKAGIVVLGG
jgi:hypothetical protein